MLILISINLLKGTKGGAPQVHKDQNKWLSTTPKKKKKKRRKKKKKKKKKKREREREREEEEDLYYKSSLKIKSINE